MDDRLRRQLEEILEQAEVEEPSETLLRQALTIDIEPDDGPWLKSIFRLAAIFLELAYGSKKEANRALPWLLFSLGMAYERTTKVYQTIDHPQKSLRFRFWCVSHRLLAEKQQKGANGTFGSFRITHLKMPRRCAQPCSCMLTFRLAQQWSGCHYLSDSIRVLRDVSDLALL